MQEDNNIRQNILAVVSGLLGEERELRHVAEDRRKALEFKPEYPVQVSEILLDGDEPMEERMMCSLMLKEYVTQFWEFKTNFCTDVVKGKTRHVLSHGLGDQNTKIMETVAYLLAIIAEADYPFTWREMVLMLIDKLRSQDQRTVIGGVTFMQECFRRIPRLIQENFSHDSMYDFFYGITEQEHVYNTTLRAKVVELVTTCLVEDYKRDRDVGRVGPTANRFTSIMGYILNQPYGPHSDFKIKATIISSYTKFLCSIPEVVGRLVSSTLPIIWDILVACADEYRQIIALCSTSNAFLQQRVLPLDCTEDQGYPKNFMTLVNNIFTIIHHVNIKQLPFADININLFLSEKNTINIFHSLIIFCCATPYTEYDIYRTEYEYYDDDLEFDVPLFYVNVRDEHFSRLGLRHLLRSMIRSSSNVTQSLACVRMAIVHAIEYMLQRHAFPAPLEVIKLRNIEEDCDLDVASAARGNQAVNMVALRQRPAHAIFTPAPNCYNVFTSRMSESIMYVLCSISKLAGSPQNVVTPMAQAALLQPDQTDPLTDRPGAMSVTDAIDSLMLGFARPGTCNRAPRVFVANFTIREFLNKYNNIVRIEDILLNCRSMLVAAHYGWVFSEVEYGYHIRKLVENLHVQYEVIGHASMRALQLHCSYFKGFTQPASNQISIRVRTILQIVFNTFVPEFIECLTNYSANINVGMLNVMVASLTDLVMINGHASESMVNFVITALVGHMQFRYFVKNVKLLIEMLTCFVSNKSFFQRQLIEPILNIIRHGSRNATVDQSVRYIGKAVGLELFCELLRTIDDAAIEREIVDLSFRTVYVAMMTGPPEVDVVRHGQRCLSMYLMRFVENLCMHGNHSVNHDSFLKVFDFLMDLNQPEELCIGLEHPFLCMLIIYHEEFILYLDVFARSLLSRLNHALSLNVRDSLIMMFLGMFFYHSESTMRLLDMLPAPDGTTSALIYIVPLMLDVRYNSAYTQNLYVHVITNIMQQAWMLNDRRILDLIVEHHYYERLPDESDMSMSIPAASHLDLSNSGVSNTSVPSTVDSDNAIPPVYRQEPATSTPTSTPTGTPTDPSKSESQEPKLKKAKISVAKASTSEQPIKLHFSPVIANKNARAVGIGEPTPSTSSASFMMTSAGPSADPVAGPSAQPEPDESDEVINISEDSVEIVESMDMSYGSSNTAPESSTSRPLDLQSLELSPMSPQIIHVEDFTNRMVPFLRKAFRMILTVLLNNRRNDPPLGEITLPETIVFPYADPRMDIRRYQESAVLSQIDVVEFIDTFLTSLIERNYLEQYELCVDIISEHKEEVDRLLLKYSSRNNNPE